MSRAESPKSPWLKWDSDGQCWRPAPMDAHTLAWVEFLKNPLPAMGSDGGLWQRMHSVPWQVPHELVEDRARRPEHREHLIVVNAFAHKVSLKLAKAIIGNFQKLLRHRVSVQQFQQHDLDGQQPSGNLDVQLVKRTFFHRLILRLKGRR